MGALFGLDWRMLVALLSSFVAKENAIATMAILYTSGGSEETLAGVLSTVVTPASGLAFLVIQMLFIPCAATVAAIRQETRSWFWTAFSVLLHLVISFGIGALVYQLASAVP